MVAGASRAGLLAGAKLENLHFGYCSVRRVQIGSSIVAMPAILMCSHFCDALPSRRERQVRNAKRFNLAGIRSTDEVGYLRMAFCLGEH